MPDTSSLAFPGPSRSNSLASTASSGSGASLSRRSRIVRKRTGTITQDSSRHENTTEPVDQVLDISAANSVDPACDPSPISPTMPRSVLAACPRLSADAVLGFDTRNESDADRSCATFGTFGPPRDGHEVPPGDHPHSHPSQSQPGRAMSFESIVSHPTAKGKGKYSHRLTSPPSSFKPAPMDADRTRSSFRDSLLTQQSSSSSSVYPMSSSMGTESPPSPLSPVSCERGVPIPAFELDGPKVQEFDADDVSYRLQLLVKNSYFLPPAHSKPSLADFPSSLPNTKKAPSPTFLDLFRVGKPKSKPASPDDSASPILRATSDITTNYGQIARSSCRHSPQTFRPPPGSQHIARVVVVREKMEDLAAAARQAEMDLGRHNFALDRAFRRARLTIFDGVVDPTETVDVPPPSANYPLALQASALHGLGIEDSVGAAILAERLPPPGSPGQSTLEDAWRKALLHEAVGHSLNNSRATSSASASCSPTPTKYPLRAPSSESLRSHRAVAQQRRLLDQKILSHPIIDPFEDHPPPAASVPNSSTSVAAGVDPDLQQLSNLPPMRAETPVSHTPLSPPPRQPLYNAQFSRSQTNIVLDDSTCQAPGKMLRKSISSPMLSDKQLCKANGTVVPSKSPPLPVPISPVPSSFDNRMSRITLTTHYTSSEVDEQVAEDHPGRPSLAITLPSSDGRPSISEYSQPSPTVSAFRDRMTGSFYSINSGGPEECAGESHNPPAFNHHPRLSTMSPPPRPSSSIAGIALPPPPRTNYTLLQHSSSRTLAKSPRTSSQSTAPSFVSDSTLSQSTQALPRVSSQSFHSALQSAPPPSSTTEFFDHIQAHTDAMDDLDDSDDSASETDPDVTAVFGSAPRRPKMMRLGNLSTPNVYPGATEPYYPSVTLTERRKPVGHTAPKASYFSRVKGTPDSLTHLSLARRSREHLVSTQPPRAAPEGANVVRQRKKDQRMFQESSRQLDGLLIQHMQVEKDTLKRIAETSKGTN